ncbi:MAG: GreA/GreB family elongation factor [Clostridia bacterium]|nr:GreA/GreB family elongation factor [Clostridia bacterium]
MYDELTQVDIKKIEEEIDYRRDVLGPKLGAELQRAREFGDLSENAEYKEAKRDKRKNDGRIRYLENMLRTARVIDVEDKGDAVSLFDYVTITNEKIGKQKRIQIVTTLRQNALLGYVSKESPLGSVLLGMKLGERAFVKLSDTDGYYVRVEKIEKGEDNEDLPISRF